MKQLVIQLQRKIFENYHQQTANLIDSDQNNEYIFGKNNNYHRIGNACLQFELTKEKYVAVAAQRVLVDGDAIRIFNNAFAYCFKASRLCTTGCSDIEHNKYVCQVSTIARALTSKYGDLVSHFDKIDESEAEIEKTSLHLHLIINHDLPANKGEVKGVLPLKHIFGFYKTFKKIIKQLGFHPTLSTAGLQDIIYTTLGDNSKVNSDKLFLFLPILIPDAQTQIVFTDSIKDSFPLTSDSWNTDRKTVDTELEHQVDIGIAQNRNSPKYLILAHQTAVRVGVANKANIVAVLKILVVEKIMLILMVFVILEMVLVLIIHQLTILINIEIQIFL